MVEIYLYFQNHIIRQNKIIWWSIKLFLNFIRLIYLIENFNSMVGLIKFNGYKKLFNRVSMPRLKLGVSGSPPKYIV